MHGGWFGFFKLLSMCVIYMLQSIEMVGFFCKDSAFCLSNGCPYCQMECAQCCSTFWWSVTSWVGVLFLTLTALGINMYSDFS